MCGSIFTYYVCLYINLTFFHKYFNLLKWMEIHQQQFWVGRGKLLWQIATMKKARWCCDYPFLLHLWGSQNCGRLEHLSNLNISVYPAHLGQGAGTKLWYSAAAEKYWKKFNILVIFFGSFYMILGSQPQTSPKKQLSDIFLFCVWIHAHTAWCMRRWAQTTASSELSRNHSSQEATSPPNHPVLFHVMLNPIILAKNDPLNGAVKTKWSRWDFNLNSPVNLWDTDLESGLSGGWCVGVKNPTLGKGLL